MNKLYYASQCKDKSTLEKSGSGGMFFTLSKEIFDMGGVVYGASFINDFKDVEIVRCDNIANLDKLLGSKYLMSSAKNSFSQVKEDLENGVLVLYSGLPCQIHTLKNYLKKDYENLICVETICHGTLPSNIWKDYLETISDNKKVISLNMRDKRNGWYDYGMAIKFEDGTEFFENHKNNKYMNTFLCDKYLNKSCYDCKFKNDFSKADLSIGDFWGLVTTKLPLDKKVGTNLVVINTERGKELFDKISNYIVSYPVTKEVASTYNAGLSNKINIEPIPYNKGIFKEHNKVGILTLNFNDNIGGVLQSYALQQFLGKNYYDATTIQSHEYWHKLSFVKKLKCKSVQDFSKLKNEFDSYIVGSDQVWRREFISGKWAESWKSWEPLFLKFTKGWNVNRVAYSASYGNDKFDFDNVINDVKTCLNNFDAISMREIDATKYIGELTSKEVVTTCDPTMLLDKEDYIKVCKEIPSKENGLHSYILDSSDTKTKIENNILSKLNIKKIDRKPHSVEEWLASYRDCKCVLTDSYHGVVFSIIFNKPFICIYNKGRGGSRFNTLIELFGIKDRVVTSEQEIDYSLLEVKPNIDYSKLVEFSKEFLLNNLEPKRSVPMEKVNPVFGIISWFPDKEPERTQRIERLNKMLKQLVDIFGEDIHFMIVAQNWKENKIPEFVKNVTIFRYNKLGILGARKKLGVHFLESNYDYLIMCDDDIVLDLDSTFTKEYFFNTLNENPNGFVFLKYGWSLTFCAISKFIYSQTPMSDIDPEKGEGYEDTVWPYLLHYKHGENEFTLKGIRFLQHKQEFHVDHKSTWDSKKVDHKALNDLTHYYVERFKKGLFNINPTVKEKAKTYINKKKWLDEALFEGWISKEDVDKFFK